MTAIARLTRAELRKLATTRTFLITLALSAGLAVISVVVDASVAGKNGTPPLGTTASTYQMLKFGAVASVAMLVLGIISSGGEYRHRTISRPCSSPRGAAPWSPPRPSPSPPPGWCSAA